MLPERSREEDRRLSEGFAAMKGVEKVEVRYTRDGMWPDVTDVPGTYRLYAAWAKEQGGMPGSVQEVQSEAWNQNLSAYTSADV